LTNCVLQGSAATDFRGGGSFNSNCSSRSLLNLTVKTLWNSVHFCRSNHKNKSGPLLRHGVQWLVFENGIKYSVKFGYLNSIYM